MQLPVSEGVRRFVDVYERPFYTFAMCVNKEDPMEYLEHSESITGYRVKVMRRGAFTVKGYTLIVPPTGFRPREQSGDGVLDHGREIGYPPRCRA